MNRATVALGIALCTMMSIGAVAAHPADPPPGPAGAPGPVGYGGKISALRPGELTLGSGGPADERSLAAKLLPAVLPVFGTDINLGGGNETTIATNPANPLNFMAGANNNARFTTTDGGLTWNAGSLAGGGDPAVAFDAAGNAYFAELGNTSGCPDIPRVYKSTDGGLTFGPPVNTLVDPSPSDHFIDKEWMGVDNSPGSPHFGRIYYTVTNFHTPAGCDLNNYIDNRIQLTYSDNQGATWSAPVTVSDASHDQNQFSLPRIASDGTLYVGYQYQNCTFNCSGIPAYQMLAKSTDGGMTFSPSITITGAAITYTGPSVAGYQYLYAGSTNTGFRHNDQEVIEVSPTNPNQLYAVWSDGRFESSFVYQGVTGQHADIVFTRSTDGGLTWTAPVKINDDAVQGKDQFFPWLKVGSDGTIHVSWMDRRDAPVDGFPYREYYTQSSDGGLTWSANQPVADVGGVPGSFIGDYSGIAVNSNNSLVLPIWTDSRGGQRAYTDRGVIGNPPATNTVTTTPVPPSATRTATTVPPSATATATTVPPSATATTVPPSATVTVTSVPPSITVTSVPPSATVTSAPPSATATAGLPSATTTAGATASPTGLSGTATVTPLPPSATRTVSATATACPIRFSDVTDPTAYYYQGVYYLACRGVISGYSDGTYKPFNNTTRGQMTKIVTLAFNIALVTPPALNSRTFTDVLPDNVFYQLIETAAARSIVSGYTCGGSNSQTGAPEPCDSARRPYFRPANFVTRGQLTKIVLGGAGFPLVNPTTPTFLDVPRSDVFYQAIETAVCHGIISGYSDNTFRPNNYAFRGQIAKIVYLAVTNPAGTCQTVAGR